MSRRIKGPDGKIHLFPDDATDAEISGALEAIPASNAKDAPKARTWTDTAVDAIPVAAATLGGIIGATGGGLPAVGGAAFGGMVGDALKQAANKLRGADVPETVPEALGEMASEAATSAAVAAPFAGAQALAPVVGASLRTAGKVAESGADILRDLLSLSGHGWKSKLAKLTIPPLVRAGGKATQATGTALERLAGTAPEQQALRTRLARIPIEGRLAEIGADVGETAAPKIAAETAQVLADDVSLIRESISKGMDTKTAIRIIANGSAEYADVLKDAYTASVKRGGLPIPEAMQKLLTLPAFQRLPRP